MGDESKLGIARIPIRATMDELDKDLSAARGKIEKAASGMQGIIGNAGKLAISGAVAGLAAVSAAVIGIGAASINVGMEFDAAFDTLATKTGATGERLDTLKGDFKAVFADIPTDAESAAAVIGTLNQRLDVTGRVGQEAAKSILEATRLLGGDAVRNTELLTRVMGDWDIEGDGAALTMDKIFAASQATGIGMDSLMGRVVQFGAPMRLMGFSLNDSIALFGKWEKEGVNAELAMGSLRIAAGKFARENRPLKEALLETFDAIQNTTDSSAALALGMDVFGARAGPDMVAAIREGRFAVGDLMKAMENAEGSIERTAEATDDFPEKLEKLKNKAKLALAPLGEAFMDVANLVVDKATPLVEQGLDTARIAIENFISLLKDEGYVDFGEFFQKFGDIGEIIGRFVATIGQIAGGQDVPQAITDLGTFLKARFSLIWNDQVAPELATWPGKFWEWLTGKGGALEKATGELDKIPAKIREWSGGVDFAAIGSDIGTAIIAGVTGKMGAEESGTNAILAFLKALGEALVTLDAAIVNAGGQIGIGIAGAIAEAIGGEEAKKLVTDKLNKLLGSVTLDIALGPFGGLVRLSGIIPGYGLRSYDSGGTVPGPVGMPQLAVVHGGETWTPAGSMTFGGSSEHTIRFENVPAGIDQSGLERVVREVMASDLLDYRRSR